MANWRNKLLYTNTLGERLSYTCLMHSSLGLRIFHKGKMFARKELLWLTITFSRYISPSFEIIEFRITQMMTPLDPERKTCTNLIPKVSIHTDESQQAALQSGLWGTNSST